MTIVTPLECSREQSQRIIPYNKSLEGLRGRRFVEELQSGAAILSGSKAG
jgi:hypothetical protein